MAILASNGKNAVAAPRVAPTPPRCPRGLFWKKNMAVVLIMLNVVCTYIKHGWEKQFMSNSNWNPGHFKRLSTKHDCIEFRYSENLEIFFSNLVAFSEYLNFKKIGIKYEWCSSTIIFSHEFSSVRYGQFDTIFLFLGRPSREMWTPELVQWMTLRLEWWRRAKPHWS